MKLPLTNPCLAICAFEAYGLSVQKDSLKVVRQHVKDCEYIPLIRALSLKNDLLHIRIDTGRLLDQWSSFKCFCESEVLYDEGFQIGYLTLTLTKTTYSWTLERSKPQGLLWKVVR